MKDFFYKKNHKKSSIKVEDEIFTVMQDLEISGFMLNGLDEKLCNALSLL